MERASPGEYQYGSKTEKGEKTQAPTPNLKANFNLYLCEMQKHIFPVKYHGYIKYT